MVLGVVTSPSNFTTFTTHLLGAFSLNLRGDPPFSRRAFFRRLSLSIVVLDRILLMETLPYSGQTNGMIIWLPRTSVLMPLRSPFLLGHPLKMA